MFEQDYQNQSTIDNGLSANQMSQDRLSVHESNQKLADSASLQIVDRDEDLSDCRKQGARQATLEHPRELQQDRFQELLTTEGGSCPDLSHLSQAGHIEVDDVRRDTNQGGQWNPYLATRDTEKTPARYEDALSKLHQKSSSKGRRSSRNPRLAGSASGESRRGCAAGNATRWSVASLGRSSAQSQNAIQSPLTYLLKDTKILDGEKIKEPVLRQKYMKRRPAGYTSKAEANRGARVMR